MAKGEAAAFHGDETHLIRLEDRLPGRKGRESRLFRGGVQTGRRLSVKQL
jgi:hypothetical protein